MTPEQTLNTVRARIAAAEQAAGRPPGSVSLLAVGKGHDSEAIRALAAAGQHRFGESWLNEATAKLDDLQGLALEWHFIGPIQSNKTRGIAARFDWVHGVDRLKIARRLSEQRPATAMPLNVCVQINISDEAGKSGVAPPEVSELVRAVAQLPGLRLRGLMTIPAVEPDPQRRRAAFRRLTRLQRALNHEGLALDTLSMGMSDDLEDAIAEGATLVRVGSALFEPWAGPRPGKPEDSV